MPNCSKCNAVQSKLNKGELCKKCFNDKINPTDNINNTNNTVNDDPIEIDPMDDRSIIDLFKSQMIKEAQWNNEINQVLYDQIDYLKSEIKHKNYIIENIIKSSLCNTEQTVTSSNDYCEKHDASTIINDNNRVIISSDDTPRVNNGVYKIIEHDDILSGSNNEWQIDNRKRRHNKSYNIPKRNANVVHANRFNVLCNNNNNENYNTTYDVNDEQEPIRENIISSQNRISVSQLNKIFFRKRITLVGKLL